MFSCMAASLQAKATFFLFVVFLFVVFLFVIDFSHWREISHYITVCSDFVNSQNMGNGLREAVTFGTFVSLPPGQ